MINRKSERTMRRTDTAFYHTSQTPKSQPSKTGGSDPLSDGTSSPPLCSSHPLPFAGLPQLYDSDPLPQTRPPQTYGGRPAKTAVGFFLPPMIEGS